MKSLLRPLRNALLASSQTTPERQQTPQERNVERNIARVKGFTYLKTIDEILSWDEDSEYHMQCSNIPLVPRPPPAEFEKGLDEKAAKANILLVHDYGTAYHDYEASNCCVGVSEPKFTLDAGQMQFIDSFCYFSHNLVSCPPPSWINTLHLNGVSVLGTFIIEPQTPIEEVGRILGERDEEGFVVARLLGRMARWVGFEGWVVNIEGVFPHDIWSVGGMCEFLEQLRGEGCEVVWYDALTTNNKVSHENGLTSLNLPFVLSAGSLLTNYAWNPSKISSSLSLARQNSLSSSNLHFGIDIWAQNKPRSFFHPRITWPLLDGGGTNTGLAVAKCAKLGVSAALFGPAWCHEHFPSPLTRKEAEDALWQGDELMKDVECECRAGWWEGGKMGTDVHRTGTYREFPVVKSARRPIAGAESGFWTSFDRGVTAHGSGMNEVFGGKGMHAQLGCQAIPPLRLELDGDEEKEKELWWEIEEQPSRLTIFARVDDGQDSSQRYVKLYNLGVRVVAGTRLMLHYRLRSSSSAILVGILIGYRSSSDESQQFIQLGDSHSMPIRPFSYQLSPSLDNDARVVEIGVAITGPMSSEQAVLEIMQLAIGPEESFSNPEDSIIATNIVMDYQGEDEWRHGRLRWGLLPPEAEKRSKWWSEKTGPIAYFEVWINGVVIGRAYGLEFVLPDYVMRKWENAEGVLVEVSGVLFGGTRLMRSKRFCRKGV